MPCLGGWGAIGWYRGTHGEFGTHAGLLHPRLERRLRWITECAAIGAFTFYNFFYWKTKQWRFFIEVESTYIQKKVDGRWITEMHIPQNKTCYYLGSYATYWDAENRAIRAPNQLWSLKDYPIHNRPFLFGEYIAETEQAQIDALRRKYGPWNMFAWSNPSRLTPMQKRAFTEDVMQPDGTWKPSIYSDMEHDFSGITLLHKRVNLENIFSQQAWIDEINAKYENCIKNEYPGQKPSTWTKPTARDFQRPVTDLQLPEPTAFARPMGIPGETVLTLNLLFYTIEERAFGIQTNIGIKL